MSPNFFPSLVSSRFDREDISNTRESDAPFPNASKFVKNTPLRVVFSTFLSVFGNVVTDGLSFYYLNIEGKKENILTNDTEGPSSYLYGL